MTKLFAEELLDWMETKVDSEGEYINPHFLIAITNLVWDYYELENDKLNTEVKDMFER